MSSKYLMRVAAFAVFFATGQAASAASVDKAAQLAMDGYGHKINFECGTNFTVVYDVESLKKNNLHISRDQTDGGNECNEPLRYLWYACRTQTGKAAVRKLSLSKIVCKGVPGKTGRLSRAGGVITVDRVDEEAKPYVRSLKQFQAATGISVSLKDPDPYHDQEWSQLRWKDNPVTDTKSYCLLDNVKKQFDDSSTIYSPYEHQKKTGTVKCWKNGKPYVDLKFVAGKKTGFVTNTRDDSYWMESYKDGKRDGLAQRFEKGRLVSEDMYKADDHTWDKEYFPNGKLKSYDLKIPDNKGYGRVSFQEDGRIDSIECKPEVRGDRILEKLCGLGKAMTVKVYDRSGKVKNTFVFKDGLMQSQAAGESEGGSKSDVKFVNGKRNGPEKVYTKNGKLAALIQWKDGAKNGPEKQYHTDGRKVIKLINWKADVVADQTEFFLNGNPKTKETFLSENQKKVQDYYDSGQLRSEGVFVRCRSGYYTSWCEDGLHKSFFEDGKRYTEVSYKTGVISGTSRRWYGNGKLSEQVEYVDGKVRSRRYYDEKGNLREAAEYEEDGSKKVKKK